jgi:hypothetical protein
MHFNITLDCVTNIKVGEEESSIVENLRDYKNNRKEIGES